MCPGRNRGGIEAMITHAIQRLIDWQNLLKGGRNWEIYSLTEGEIIIGIMQGRKRLTYKISTIELECCLIDALDSRITALLLQLETYETH